MQVIYRRTKGFKRVLKIKKKEVSSHRMCFREYQDDFFSHQSLKHLLSDNLNMVLMALILNLIFSGNRKQQVHQQLQFDILKQ